MSEELTAAIAHLEVYGYCLLPERIPREEALILGTRCLKLHADSENAAFIHGDEYYQTLFGMLNLCPMWPVTGCGGISSRMLKS